MSRVALFALLSSLVLACVRGAPRVALPGIVLVLVVGGLLVAGLWLRGARAHRPRTELEFTLGAGAVVALLLFAAARGALDARRLPAFEPKWPPGQSRLGWVEGRMLDPAEASRSGWRSRLAVESSTLALQRDTPILVRFGEDLDAPRVGDRVRALIDVHVPEAPRTPGGFDERSWLRQRRAVLAATVHGRSLLVLESAPRTLRGELAALRESASRRIRERVPGDAGEFLRGLVLGERGRIAPESTAALRRAGVLHLLALSGQHVAIVAALLAGALRAAGLRGRASFLPQVAAIWAYALLTGASPSVVRATAAASLTAWGASLGRTAGGADVLSGSAALCLTVAPSLAADLGFQLSCLASAGLLLAGALERAARSWIAARRDDVPGLAPLRRWGFPLAPLASLALATACAQLFVLPLLALRFGTVSVIGLVSNLLLVPVCGALLVLVLPLLALDGVIPTPGEAWRCAALLAGFLLERGHEFGGRSDAVRSATLDEGHAVLLYAVAAAGAGALALRARAARGDAAARVPQSGGAACATALAVAACGVWLGGLAVSLHPLRPRATATLTYWVLDVGQGEAQVLEFAGGRTLLVDCGDAREGYDAGANVVIPFLRARRIARLDSAVITHEDRDHAGGLGAIEREIPVKELASGREALRELGRSGRTLAAGDTLCAGSGYVVRVLWPPAGITGLAGNARSVVLEVEAGGRAERLLLTGDADSLVEARWLPSVSGGVRCLKLGHHGSRSSSGGAVLDLLAPETAVVSCGRENRFGHPHAETLARLEARGIPVRRTDREGTIRLDFGPAPPPASAVPRPRLGV